MTIRHHSHGCPLKWYEGNGFKCDGCGLDGTGGRFRCKSCNFDLHLSCARYTFPCHGHELTYEPCVRPGGRIICNACNSRVDGVHYHCRSCNFHVHPACVQVQPRTTTVPSLPQPCAYCVVYCVYCVRCNPSC